VFLWGKNIFILLNLALPAIGGILKPPFSTGNKGRIKGKKGERPQKKFREEKSFKIGRKLQEEDLHKLFCQPTGIQIPAE
jgi:hypothetical protein